MLKNQMIVVLIKEFKQIVKNIVVMEKLVLMMQMQQQLLPVKLKIVQNTQEIHTQNLIVKVMLNIVIIMELNVMSYKHVYHLKVFYDMCFFCCF